MKKLLLLALLSLGLMAGNSMQAYCASCTTGYGYGYSSYPSYSWGYGDGCCRGSLHWGSYYL